MNWFAKYLIAPWCRGSLDKTKKMTRGTRRLTLRRFLQLSCCGGFVLALTNCATHSPSSGWMRDKPLAAQTFISPITNSALTLTALGIQLDGKFYPWQDCSSTIFACVHNSDLHLIIEVPRECPRDSVYLPEATAKWRQVGVFPHTYVLRYGARENARWEIAYSTLMGVRGLTRFDDGAYTAPNLLRDHVMGEYWHQFPNGPIRGFFACEKR
jgi:hypothetical protein